MEIPCSYAPILASKPLVVHGFFLGFRSSFFINHFWNGKKVYHLSWLETTLENTNQPSHTFTTKNLLITVNLLICNHSTTLPGQYQHQTPNKTPKSCDVMCPWDPQTTSAKEVRKSPVRETRAEGVIKTLKLQYMSCRTRAPEIHFSNVIVLG